MDAPLPQICDEGTAVSTAFDYSRLPPADVEVVHAAEDAIRQHALRHIDEAIAIGRELLRVKTILKHGQFGQWINATFPFSERSASNYMRAAKVYGDKSEMVADLPLPPALLYRAASSSISEADRRQVFAPTENGSKPTEKLIVSRLKQIRLDAVEGKKKEEQSNTPEGAREKRRSEKEHQEREEPEREAAEPGQRRNEATTALAQLLAARLSDEEIREFSRLWADAELDALPAELRNIRQGAQQ